MTLLRKCPWLFAGLAVLAVGSPRVFADDAATPAAATAKAADPVLLILVQKGLITQAEADQVQAEIDAGKAAPASQKAETVPATPTPTTPTPSKLAVSGFIDGYAAYNFNRPNVGLYNAKPGVGPLKSNQYHNFDFEDREFSFNMAELNINKDPDPVGMHVSLAAGPATDWVHGTEPGGVETYKHLLQAYGTYASNFAHKTTFTFGKFVTWNGAEVIETKDNWNYSRGLLFAWAIPYYHMGISTHTPLNAKNYVNLYLVNGWNDVKDNNTGKTFGLQYGWTPNAKWSLIQNYTGGPEQVNNDRNWRHLFDTILTYNASAATSFVLNYDFATEKETSPAPHAKWEGLAGYAKYTMNPKDAIVGRLEWFHDKQGVATGTAQTLNEGTLTYEHKLADNLITRYEYRHDWSSQKVFVDHSGGLTKKGQDELLAGAVVLF